MGANGLQEIEDLNNEGRNKQVSPGVKIVLDGSCKQLTMVAKEQDVYYESNL